MSDVLRCDTCTILSAKPAHQWYTVWHDNDLFRTIASHDTGPWHFCCLRCMNQWTSVRVSEKHMEVT